MKNFLPNKLSLLPSLSTGVDIGCCYLDLFMADWATIVKSMMRKEKYNLSGWDKIAFSALLGQVAGVCWTILTCSRMPLLTGSTIQLNPEDWMMSSNLCGGSWTSSRDICSSHATLHNSSGIACGNQERVYTWSYWSNCFIWRLWGQSLGTSGAGGSSS